ncbi:MAG: hypothetical protein IJG83_08270, partial [Thermoguttaceae bacterium]|nr:hypothetical protein [Thermoguttaceae bacterium]
MSYNRYKKPYNQRKPTRAEHLSAHTAHYIVIQNNTTPHKIIQGHFRYGRENHEHQYPHGR